MWNLLTNFRTSSSISNFNTTLAVGAGWYTWTDGRTDMTKLKGVFRYLWEKRLNSVQISKSHSAYLPIIPKLRLGESLLIVKISRSYSNTPQSLGLLWASNQLLADTSTWQLTTDRHPLEPIFSASWLPQTHASDRAATRTATANPADINCNLQSSKEGKSWTAQQAPSAEGEVWTYLITAWSRVLLDNITGSQLVKKYPAFYGTRRFMSPYPEPVGSSP